VDQAVAEGLPLVTKLLDEHVTAALASLPAAGVDYRDLWLSIQRQFEGGKNLRPSLTIAAYVGLGGDDLEAVAPVAASMEMLHTAMLIHDDVLDHDEVRRGRPNVAGERRKDLSDTHLTAAQIDDHVMASALLGGDLALSSSYELILQAPLPAHHRLACLQLVTRAIRTTIAGEQLDMFAAVLHPEQVNALLIAELKTATYTCTVPLLAGAQLAGADPTMVSHLEKIGMSLGLSFQIMDDDLGVFGDPEITGKSVLSDLRAGKRTEMLRLAFDRADEDGLAVLNQHIGNPDLTEDDAAEVRRVLEESGARRQALKVAKHYARVARTTASERTPTQLSRHLTGLIDQLAERDW
jgi:geranylgeranyl diphosphate synthase type II